MYFHFVKVIKRLSLWEFNVPKSHHNLKCFIWLISADCAILMYWVTGYNSGPSVEDIEHRDLSYLKA